MMRVGAGLSLAVTTPLLAIGTAAVKMAADTEESESKFEAVFKDMAKETRVWSEAMAKDVNRSAIDLRDFSSSVQDTFVPLGFARDEAAGLSRGLVELGVDLASFNNKAEPEVMQALTSALVGNHEAVRQFGISITATTLKAELLRLGMNANLQSATNLEKVQPG